MRVSLGAITHLAGRGKHSLQVPEWTLGGGATDMVDLPEKFFTRLKVVSGGHRTALGREQGFLHLSEAGYNGFKPNLLAAYTAAGGNPADFEAWATNHFVNVATQDLKERQRRLARASETPAKVQP